jgi:prepilin-type processing-associated H-X9-DG protein
MSRVFPVPTAVTVAVGLVAMGGVLGCSAGGPSSDTEGLEDLHPVSGSVSFEGKPTPGAIVMFYKVDDPTSKGVRIVQTNIVTADGWGWADTGNSGAVDGVTNDPNPATQ